MPVRKTKDDIYRILLRFFAPSARSADLRISGKQLCRADEYMDILREHHVLGSAMLLSKNGFETVACSSVTEPEHRAEEDTLFRVASITKIAVSLTVGILRDRGLVDIDMPVGEYLPKDIAGDAAQRITLRQLLSHTSGIKDPPEFEKYVITRVPLDKLLSDPDIYAPSAERVFRYSNLGFGMIGCVMEYVTGLTVDEVMRSLLFAPLCMNATMHPESRDAAKIMPISRVLPYRKGRDTVLTALARQPLERPDPYTHYGFTAGSMYSDVRSLKRLLDCVRTGRGIDGISDWTKLMVTPAAVYGASSPTLAYGLGMQIINDRSISENAMIGHQGFAYGCVDAAFFETGTGSLLIFLNGGCSVSRIGRIGRCNNDLLHWAFRKELPEWSHRNE